MQEIRLESIYEEVFLGIHPSHFRLMDIEKLADNDAKNSNLWIVSPRESLSSWRDPDFRMCVLTAPMISQEDEHSDENLKIKKKLEPLYIGESGKILKGNRALKILEKNSHQFEWEKRLWGWHDPEVVWQFWNHFFQMTSINKDSIFEDLEKIVLKRDLLKVEYLQEQSLWKLVTADEKCIFAKKIHWGHSWKDFLSKLSDSQIFDNIKIWQNSVWPKHIAWTVKYRCHSKNHPLFTNSYWIQPFQKLFIPISLTHAKGHWIGFFWFQDRENFEEKEKEFMCSWVYLLVGQEEIQQEGIYSMIRQLKKSLFKKLQLEESQFQLIKEKIQLNEEAMLWRQDAVVASKKWAIEGQTYIRQQDFQISTEWQNFR
jgi:hypothetical protein